MAPMRAVWLSLCGGSAAAWLRGEFALSSGCAEGSTCKQVQASGFTFDCRFAGEANRSSGDVMLLHGFPEWASMTM